MPAPNRSSPDWWRKVRKNNEVRVASQEIKTRRTLPEEKGKREASSERRKNNGTT